ncbi:MAG: hypothetical protein ACK4SQ_14530 [Allorhizobium sp.]
MSDKTALWDKLGKTDPKHTKTFKRSGGFEGTAIKPMFSYRRMTEEFGPCGTGWGVGEPSFQVVPGENREVLVYCTASVWYLEGVKVSTVYGVGGDKVVTHIKANEKYNRPERWESDDEAFKKAFTDAVTNALKFIGVGADVHMGMFDDSKYVNTVAREFAEEKPANDKKAHPSYAEMKRQLEEIDRELLDCGSLVSVEACAKSWQHIATRDAWPADYKKSAADKFAAKREQLQKEAA